MQPSSSTQAAKRCSQDKAISPSEFVHSNRAFYNNTSTIAGSDLYKPSESYMADLRRLQEEGASDSSTSSSVGMNVTFFADAAESYPFDDQDGRY
jgi:poly(3-hydroxyalkanoate) synthetase